MSEIWEPWGYRKGFARTAPKQEYYLVCPHCGAEAKMIDGTRMAYCDMCQQMVVPLRRRVA